MKKLLVLSVLCLVLGGSSISAQQLSGQVSKNWNVEKARKEAFKSIPENVDLSKYSPVNPFHNQVIEAKKNNVNKISNCEIESFDDGTYAIREYGSLEGLYYDKEGNLKAIHLDDGNNYPKTTYKYLYPQGYLIGVSISPERGNNFIFFYDGEFVLHWIGNNAYNEKGDIVETRKTITEEEF